MLVREAEKCAPLITSILAAIVEPTIKFRSKRPGRLAAVGTGLSVLLREKCHSLCLPQTLNSVVMYTGHEQVIIHSLPHRWYATLWYYIFNALKFSRFAVP